VLVAADALPPVKALPTDVGVYFKAAGGDWIEVEPEIVNRKTGGVAKSAFTYGIVKGDLNGHIKGAKSHNKMLGSNEVLVVPSEGVAATEYQLLRMRQHGDSREFRAATGSVFHQSGGSDRDLVEFEHQKIASRNFF
jgi:hypothetical protein